MKINFATMKINFAIMKINFAIMQIDFALMKIDFAIMKINFAKMKTNFALIEICQLYTNENLLIIQKKSAALYQMINLLLPQFIFIFIYFFET